MYLANTTVRSGVPHFSVADISVAKHIYVNDYRKYLCFTNQSINILHACSFSKSSYLHHNLYEITLRDLQL